MYHMQEFLPNIYPEEEDEDWDEEWYEEEEDNGDTTRAICRWIWRDLDIA